MKLHYLFFLLLSVFTNTVTAQNKNDFNWILGYSSANPELFFGGDWINFNEGNPAIQFFDVPEEMWVPCSMSDEDGVLQFYTNGCSIFNANHQTMENGDDINAGIIAEYYCNEVDGGYPSYNSLLALPFPGHPDQYFFIHIRRFSSSLFNKQYMDLLYSRIDMTKNEGLGAVVEKNILLLTDTISLSISAARHGNGRDYWMLAGRNPTSEYHLLLLDTAGIHYQAKQQVDSSWIPGQEFPLMGVFSPDGTKYARIGVPTPPQFMLYDFDRCSGVLSNSRIITVPDSSLYAPWLCFSPNSQYLYLTNFGERLYQFDTEDSDIDASAQLIATYDGNLSIYNLPTSFNAMAIGPDQQIYMSCGNGTNVLHTIHQPDLPGNACDFRQHDLEMPAHSLFFLPNLPNYRLYQATGSACDTLGVQPPVVAFWKSSSDTLMGNLTRSFHDLSWYQPVSWYWDFGDGTTSTLEDNVHTFPAPALYDVCLTVCNATGACDTLCRSIDLQISGSGHIQVPSDVSAGIYPNPAINEIWVTHIAGNDQVFSLYDQLGRIVHEQQLSEKSEAERIVLSTVSPGMFFWVIHTGPSVTGNGKLVLVPETK
jgi:PKD domain/Secretion system C-terminal sorting domain